MRRRFRYRFLRSLRQWRDRALAFSNEGQKRRAISDRPEVWRVSTECGWTSYGSVDFYDGFEIREMHRGFTEDLLDSMIVAVYRRLGSRET